MLIDRNKDFLGEEGNISERKKNAVLFAEDLISDWSDEGTELLSGPEGEKKIENKAAAEEAGLRVCLL